MPINDSEEIVVKPLGKQLKNVKLFAGATIMGDGKVALILDVLGLAQRAHVVSEGRARAASDGEAKQPEEVSNHREHQRVLLVQCGEDGRMAIDLATVARLEEFPPSAVELAGERETVQYRGQIMALVRLSEVVETRHKPVPRGERALEVVVYADKERNVGLVVDRILDIVDESFRLELEAEALAWAFRAAQQKVDAGYEKGTVVENLRE